MKRFLTSVSLQHEPKASDEITLVKKTFFRTSIVRNFISRGVKMRISAREECKKFFQYFWMFFFNSQEVREVRYFTSKVAIFSFSALVVRKVTGSEII